eukprot:TRINITY_DN30952_c0_g2_i2.p2 TRINITY_DN30952_c0_g2~~TRINITY_DN30952_c0_g2_i2.p2  ORF type:complete len:150 (+),score=19.64 TRINITY_DN30952_c0_g2_i2:1292-1741(+)
MIEKETELKRSPEILQFRKDMLDKEVEKEGRLRAPFNKAFLMIDGFAFQAIANFYLAPDVRIFSESDELQLRVHTSLIHYQAQGIMVHTRKCSLHILRRYDDLLAPSPCVSDDLADNSNHIIRTSALLVAKTQNLFRRMTRATVAKDGK